MDNRRYNIMRKEVEAKVAQIRQDFVTYFYSRELRNARINSEAISAFNQVKQQPEPIEEIPTPEVPLPEFEE